MLKNRTYQRCWNYTAEKSAPFQKYTATLWAQGRSVHKNRLYGWETQTACRSPGIFPTRHPPGVEGIFWEEGLCTLEHFAEQIVD